VCSARAGAVPGRNRVPGTCFGNWFRCREPPPNDRFCGSKVPGSEGCVPDVSKVSVIGGLRFCSRGLDGTRSRNRVLGTRGIKKVLGSRDSVPKVPKVTLYFERALLYFESIVLYFESKHFES